MVAVVPRAVQVLDAIVRARLEVEPGVLVVVEPVAPQDVRGGAEEVDPVGRARAGARVAERLVVLDRDARRPRGEPDAMVVVVGDRVRSDQRPRSALDLDSILVGEVDGVVGDGAVRAAREVDRAVLGAGHGEAVERHVGPAGEHEAIGAVSDAGLMVARVVSPHVHVESLLRYPPVAARRQRSRRGGRGGEPGPVREHLQGAPVHARGQPHVPRVQDPLGRGAEDVGAVHHHGAALRLQDERARGGAGGGDGDLLRIDARPDDDGDAGALVGVGRRRDAAVGLGRGAGTRLRAARARGVDIVGAGRVRWPNCDQRRDARERDGPAASRSTRGGGRRGDAAAKVAPRGRLARGSNG